MAIDVAFACALPCPPLAPLRPMLTEFLREWGESIFIVGWLLLVVKFLVRCLLERILALIACILLELSMPFEIF